MFKKQDAYFKRKKDERARKSELMDGHGKDQLDIEMIWDGKVRKDLGKIPRHWALTMDDYESWYKQGFRARSGEFDHQTWEDKERRLDLRDGCALRK